MADRVAWGSLLGGTGRGIERSVSGTTYRHEPAVRRLRCTAESRITRVKCNDAFTADACLRTLSCLSLYIYICVCMCAYDVTGVHENTTSYGRGMKNEHACMRVSSNNECPQDGYSGGED